MLAFFIRTYTTKPTLWDPEENPFSRGSIQDPEVLCLGELFPRCFKPKERGGCEFLCSYYYYYSIQKSLDSQWDAKLLKWFFERPLCVLQNIAVVLAVWSNLQCEELRKIHSIFYRISTNAFKTSTRNSSKLLSVRWLLNSLSTRKSRSGGNCW